MVAISSSPLSQYQALREDARRAYARLSPSEAIEATRPTYTLFFFAIFVWACMAALIVYTAIQDFALIQASLDFSSAHAAGLHKPSVTVQPKLAAFTPPFGLPLWLYYTFICAIFLIWLFWIINSFYRAYFANPKDERAAAHIDHQVSFIFGALVGALLGHSIA
jgi:hypothetical protein